MATILLTWELGSGLGHLLPIRAVGQALAQRGHRVVAAVRDLDRVEECFAGSGISYLPAPVLPRFTKAVFEKLSGYAHILANIGFDDERMLATLFSAWNTLFDCVRPDLVVTDHSPTALLALRGRPIQRVNLGLPFYCPPNTAFLPFWCSADAAATQTAVVQYERVLTEKVNRLLTAQRRPPLQRVSQFFNEIDELILASYQEFDHFGPRPGVRYWGHWPAEGGITPQWPAASGPRVYAYLKPFPGLQPLLAELTRSAAPTIVLAGGIGRPVQERFAGPTLRFETAPLDLGQALAQCDLVVHNAGHGTTASALLAGKPCLLFPMFTEQLLNAQAAAKAGAARFVAPQGTAKIEELLPDMLTNPTYRMRAQAFAARYAGFVPGQQLPEIADRLESHIGKRVG